MNIVKNSSKKQSLFKEIEDKPKSIEDFARYAKKASLYKTDIIKYEAEIALIKSLNEVLRVNYRPLTIEEEQLHSQLQDAWKFFLAKIQETAVYVNTQSPSILEQLEALYNVFLIFILKLIFKIIIVIY